MSDITLSNGIRQNLLSLQQTSADLTTTQQQLSTGKKVNTAFDNPTSFFTSQSLTNRANDLSALLDQIGQAQQTLNAANNGLTGLTSLLEQALSTAQQAQQSATGTVTYSTIAGSVAIANDTTQATSSFTTAQAVGGTGGNPVTASVQASALVTAADITSATSSNGQTLTFAYNGTTVTATSGASDTGTTFADATGLQSILNTAFGAAATATQSAGAVTLTGNDVLHDITVTTGGGYAGAAIATTAHTTGDALTLTDGSGHSSSFYYVASNAQAADGTFNTNAQLAAAINNAASSVSTAAGGNITATANGNGTIQLASPNNKSITVAGNIGSALGFSTTAYSNNFNAQLSALTAGSTLTLQVGTDTAHTITFGTAAGDIATKTALTSAFAGFTDITAGFNGSNDILLTPTSTSPVTIGGTPGTVTSLGLALGVTTPTQTVVTPSSTRSTLQTNYNNLLTQINQLAADSSYNGVNLLNSNNLQVVFNETGTSGLTIAGVNDGATGLSLSALNGNQFQDNNQIATVTAALNAAISTVRAQTQTFGTNSSTISTRQTFETNMINTLQTGASNLVLADQNQASANLLTEQTRQQLEISALSIANQANQSVLKLFP